MIVTVKGCSTASEVVIDATQYPQLGEMLRGIVESEFLKAGDAPNGKRRGRPPKQSVPEAVPAPVENDNESPI
jgi:hypothetical protein